jgi:predicted GNAT family N-acyltransferase
MDVKRPESDDEWEGYYDLRWRILRAPWGQPRGGDPDEEQEDMLHAMIGDDAGRAIAVGRIIFKSADEAQIRSMATAEDRRGEGWGRRLMEYLEQAARNRGVKTIFLNAREEAAEFYAKLGYEAIGPGPTLFGVIPHVAMRKQL